MDFGRTLNLILFIYFMHWRLGLYKHLHDRSTLEVFEFDIWCLGLLDYYWYLYIIWYLIYLIFGGGRFIFFSIWYVIEFAFESLMVG